MDARHVARGRSANDRRMVRSPTRMTRRGGRGRTSTGATRWHGCGRPQLFRAIERTRAFTETLRLLTSVRPERRILKPANEIPFEGGKLELRERPAGARETGAPRSCAARQPGNAGGRAIDRAVLSFVLDRYNVMH